MSPKLNESASKNNVTLKYMPPTNKFHTLVVVLFRNTVKRRVHIFILTSVMVNQHKNIVTLKIIIITV